MADLRSLSSCERLESDENLAFQNRSRSCETAGRWVVALLVAGALAGLLGSGPLSRVETATPAGDLRVEYPRFARTDATYRIVVYAGPGAVVNGEVDVWIDASLMNVLQVEAIVPEPAAVELDRDRIVYRFRVAATDELAPTILHVKTDGVARHTGRIGLRDGAAVKLSLWLYP